MPAYLPESLPVQSTAGMGARVAGMSGSQLNRSVPTLHPRVGTGRLIERMTLAELTSLDELLYQMMQRGYFTSELIAVLWAYYGASAKVDVPPEHRRGAIQVLGMVSRAQPQMLASRLDVLMKIGLGSHGKVRQECRAYWQHSRRNTKHALP